MKISPLLLTVLLAAAGLTLGLGKAAKAGLTHSGEPITVVIRDVEPAGAALSILTLAASSVFLYRSVFTRREVR